MQKTGRIILFIDSTSLFMTFLFSPNVLAKSFLYIPSKGISGLAIK